MAKGAGQAIRIYVGSFLTVRGIHRVTDEYSGRIREWIRVEAPELAHRLDSADRLHVKCRIASAGLGG